MTDSLWVRDLDPHSDPDIRSALTILQQSFEDCWEERFLRKALKRSHYAILAGSGELANGCLVYHQFRRDRDILGIGVLRDSVRLGYGTALIRELQSRTQREKSQMTITTYIPPDNEVAQYLLLRQGFQWVSTDLHYGGQGPLRIFRWTPARPGDCGESAHGVLQK